jgi:predicted methyltransferase
MRSFLVGLLLFSAGQQAPAFEIAPITPFDEAIANPTRPEEDKKADENRHPKELLEFSQAKAGHTVVDVFPGQGYFVRLFSSLVGPKGKVIAYVPKEGAGFSFKPVESAKSAIAGLKNAQVKITPLMTAPVKSADVIWLSAIYHDLHNPGFIKSDIAAYNKLMFKMLKPGGYLIVIDHVGNAGISEEDAVRLHRIDPKIVRSELEAAGFVFEAESKALSRPENHSLNVFDASIRGKTDQFAYRFVKPKK